MRCLRSGPEMVSQFSGPGVKVPHGEGRRRRKVGKLHQLQLQLRRVPDGRAAVEVPGGPRRVGRQPEAGLELLLLLKRGRAFESVPGVRRASAFGRHQLRAVRRVGERRRRRRRHFARRRRGRVQVAALEVEGHEPARVHSS